MSENEQENGTDQDAGPSPVTGERDITDDQLPEDLRPTDDNPLAQEPDEDDADGGFNPNVGEDPGAGS
jgi:hypothetical protein